MLSCVLSQLWCPTFWLLLFPSFGSAVYVSYEHVRSYPLNEAIPIYHNKMTSPRTLASMDSSLLPVCYNGSPDSEQSSESSWQSALRSLHGQERWQLGPPLAIAAKKNSVCQVLCAMTLSGDTAAAWQAAIEQDYHVNIQIDGLPAAVRLEDEYRIRTRYWGGIPLGRMGGNSQDDGRYDGTTKYEAFIYNHWNVEIQYLSSGDDSAVKIFRITVQPFSVRQDYYVQDGNNNNLGTDNADAIVGLIDAVPSCSQNGQTFNHLTYESIADRAPQPAQGKVVFTYDVTWVRVESYHDVDKRWDIFLTMDDSIPLVFQIASIVFAVVINLILVGVLVTWVMHDLSYKPVYMPSGEEGDDGEDALDEREQREMALWPLSTRIFYPPLHQPFLLCIMCGMGAQLLVAGCLYVFFFRLGVINQSVDEGIITPAIIFYTVASGLGGYVTGRLCGIFYGTISKLLWTLLATAAIFPIMGMIIVHLVYDVFPDSASPDYDAVSNSWPIILLWLFIMIPLTLAGGYVGFRHGGIKFFPLEPLMDGQHHEVLIQVEEGEKSSRLYRFYKSLRTPLLFVVAGVLPVLCCFVAFAYGVAGPVYLGYYSSIKIASLAPFVLFVSCSGAVATLWHYRQIRAQNFGWWWSSFVAGSSSGLHIFILSLTWLFFNVTVGEVDAGTFAAFMFWFAYISFAISCACGAMGVACCIWFNRILYRYTMTRNEHRSDAHFPNSVDSGYPSALATPEQEGLSNPNESSTLPYPVLHEDNKAAYAQDDSLREVDNVEEDMHAEQFNEDEHFDHDGDECAVAMILQGSEQEGHFEYR